MQRPLCHLLLTLLLGCFVGAAPAAQPPNVVLIISDDQAWTDYTIGFPREGLWRVRFDSDWTGYDPGYGGWPTHDVQASASPHDSMPASGSLSIGPYTSLIFSQ